MSTSQTLIQQIIKLSPDPNLIERAFRFAEDAHRGQKRFSGEDFISHPLRVAQILNEMKLDPKTVAAGLLHDVPDDTKVSLLDLKKEFGKEIAFLVEGISKLGKLRYPKSGLEVKPVEERIEEPIDFRAENLRKMFLAMAKDLRVVLIKLADRLHNMETLDCLPPEKQKRIALETLEIFVPLADRLGIREIKAELEDLAFPYLYPKQYEWLIKNVKEKQENKKRYLERVEAVLKQLLKKEKIKPFEISWRAKSYWSLYQKLLKHEMNFDRIYDLIALRIIVEDVKTCYEALGVIHKFWKPLPRRIKDYIAFPKPNHYQALHTTCFCLDGKITEIQIETREMHREAESGICAHWAIKEGINLKTQRKKFRWVQQLRDWQKGVQGLREWLEGLKVDFFKNRIFVFTPKGDVIDLPEEATPVDFAYTVHTEIGNHCAGAKINGKINNLSQSLRNGDVVEILVDKKRKPSRDWLKFVKTTLARSRIREQIKKELPRKEPLPLRPPSPKPSSTKILPKLKQKPAQVFLAGERGIKTHLAQCCSPQTGDPIQACVTRDRGSSIHKIDCQNIIRFQQKWPQKVLKANWSASLEIIAKDRVGLLRDICSVISGLGINILSCEGKPKCKEESYRILTNIEISGRENLEQLFGQLKLIRGVIQIKKV